MQGRNLTEGLEISSALSSGSYSKVKYKRMRVSRSGMLIVHDLSHTHERTVVGHFYTRNGLIFRIPSVYYVRDFTRAVNLYAHV